VPPTGEVEEQQVTDGTPVEHIASGKVRELYAAGEDLLLVATDRISTYDVVHPTPVPDKGRILTGLAAFWFDRLTGIVPHHLITADAVEGLAGLDLVGAGLEAEWLAGRTMRCRRAQVVPFECVVRGYLAGSGWNDYRSSGRVCGIELPSGLREADPLPAPIFTPATKATGGAHDENVGFDRLVAELGGELAEQLRATSLAVYALGAAHAASVGVILADTKLEFGLVEGADGARTLLLVDEVLTPDSSRYWPADAWAPGGSPPSFDKQFVRDHVTASGWDRRPPAPALPEEVVDATRQRYVEAYERLTGQAFARWWPGSER